LGGTGLQAETVDGRELMRRIKNNQYVYPKTSPATQQISRRAQRLTQDNRWFFRNPIPTSSTSMGQGSSRSFARPIPRSSDVVISNQAYRISRRKRPNMNPPNDENSRNVSRFLIPSRPKLDNRGSDISQQVMSASHPPPKVVSPASEAVGRGVLSFSK